MVTAMSKPRTPEDLLDELRRQGVRSLLLQFTDLLGVNKAVEVHRRLIAVTPAS